MATKSKKEDPKKRVLKRKIQKKKQNVRQEWKL